jgi:hypothetical protein
MRTLTQLMSSNAGVEGDVYIVVDVRWATDRWNRKSDLGSRQSGDKERVMYCCLFW